jgi:hypothetical protein
MLPILALLAWLAAALTWGVLAAADPGVAAAHTCVTPVEVIVDQPATVTVGVAGEGVTPVVGIEITIPEGFTFDSFLPSGGWQGALEGRVLRLSGGQIAGGACGFLLVKGTATRAGTLYFPMKTTDQDGTVRVLDSTQVYNPAAAMVVEAKRPGGSGGGGLGLGPVLGVAAGVVLVTIGAVALIRRRRSADDRGARPGERGGPDGDRVVAYPTRPSRRR